MLFTASIDDMISGRFGLPKVALRVQHGASVMLTFL